MVQWWMGAAATITGLTSFCWVVHYWNEGYRQRGETHPITRFLEQFVSTEEEDRRKRIEALEKEAKAADRRLQAIQRWFPNLRDRSQ